MTGATRTLRNTAFSTLAAWTEFFLGMVVSIIVARSLAPDTYGHFSFMMWCATVYVIVTNGGLSTGIIKFIAEDDNPAERQAVLRWMHRIQLRSLLATSALAIVAGLLFPGFFLRTADPLLWGLLLLAGAAKAVYIFRNSASKGREHFRTIAGVILLVAPFNLLANAVVAWQWPSLLGFLLVYLITSLAYLACIMALEHREQEVTDLSPLRRQRIKHHLWVTGVSIILSFLVLRQSEVFFLRLFTTPEDIGFFNIAFTLAFALAALIPGAYSALLLPMMSREGSAAPGAQALRLKQSVRYLQLLALPMAFGTFALGETLVLTLYGSAYQASADVLSWTIAGVAVAAVAQAGVSMLVSGDRQSEVLKTNLGVTIAVLAIDAWAIGRWGLEGAGPAFFTGNLIHATLMLGLAMRHCAADWPWQASLRIAGAATLSWGITLLWLGAWRGALPTMAMLATGALVYAFSYALSTLMLRCWEPEERRFIQQLAKRLPSPLARLTTALLERIR